MLVVRFGPLLGLCFGIEESVADAATSFDRAAPAALLAKVCRRSLLVHGRYIFSSLSKSLLAITSRKDKLPARFAASP